MKKISITLLDSHIMKIAILATCPIVAGAFLKEGVKSLYIVLVAVFICVFFEKVIIKKYDSGSIITGILFALTLPVNIPLHIVALGSILAIGIGKHAFGGFRKNTFNPAIVGRILTFSLFPDLFIKPIEPDLITRASPLAKEIELLSPKLWSLIHGLDGGCIGQSIPILIIVSGVYLIYERIIDWRIPVYYILSIVIIAFVIEPSGRALGHSDWQVNNPLLHLFSGGTLLAAFFFLTDPTTSPQQKNMRIVYAVSAGIYTMFIRYFTPFPDGVAFSILLASGLTKFLNAYSIRKKKVAY